ncbi:MULTISPECIES: glycosyl transferase family 90 [Francisella]|uniref:Lipopolysaccharide A protein n=1 Tax=Francisella opportunistica TaxID=2016517 RepID=A0A345JPC7_9GAMM|nr:MULTISPECIES: glycosyl transferase family 90 [Francisella]APC90837.1 LpsA protein [Francisella sp. MA067296]AXH29173.1 lipopolysaccharide A protein [Francisella opportunistica]AXH30824.1 lipopolysaccharide A protein [Francisella opportunistica]AXH32469.1 lipopolysaccharide A protein [Francisella opportunistica]
MKKLKYYTKHLSRAIIPKKIFELRLAHKLANISKFDKDYIEYRVNYYNKLSKPFSLQNSFSWKTFKRNMPVFDIADNSLAKKSINSAYFFDFKEFLVYFSKQNSFTTAFYDLTKIPKQPTFVKSRPISDDNQNSIVLKLDKVRHFSFFDDNQKFEDKLNMAVFRGACHQPARQYFIKNYYNLPNTNFGDTRKTSVREPFNKGFLSIEEQLKYKYIISIEGYDVATNLKWIMNSNSLCFMTKPKYETWFMEGTLLPDHHYVLLKDDYSDIQEKIDYYNNHPKEALKIIKNANEYVNQFKNRQREDLISLLVMKKYFDLNKTSY